MSLEYRQASKIVDVGLQGKSIKQYCSTIKDLSKKSYALALQTLKFSTVIQEIIDEVSTKEDIFADIQKPLLYVLLYEFLFGKKDIIGGGIVKKKIIENKEILLKASNKRLKNTQSAQDLLSEDIKNLSNLPIYVRINEAKLSAAEGLEYIRANYSNDAKFDSLIPTLIELSSSTKGLSQDQYVKDGKLIIQDKASCFPSQILFNAFQRENGSAPYNFIDACAAPGNKTTHLASLVETYQKQVIPQSSSSSRVFAFEKNPSRFHLLKTRIRQYNLQSMIQPRNEDFLAVDVHNPRYQAVRYVLLDPSCSGSGILRNLERLLPSNNSANTHEDADVGDEEEEEDNGDQEKSTSERDRLLKLSSFQLSILKKAISFPATQFVVYSTCSVHCEENELVISKLLSSPEGHEWELVTPPGFSSWTRRGVLVDGIDSRQAAKMIRCSHEDGMNGFFVALLQKKNYLPPAILTPNQSHPSNQPSTKKNKRKAGELAEGEEGAAAVKNNPTAFRVSNRKKRRFSKR